MGIEAYSAFLNTKEILHKFQPVEQIILFFIFSKIFIFLFFSKIENREYRGLKIRASKPPNHKRQEKSSHTLD